MTPDSLPPDYAAITTALLAWYQAHRRDLPWRRTTDPYHIWVSEIMLQQTQVSTVIPYYERFLARFPTVAALAEASLDEVLALWQGLGYYARARSLHKAARIVRDKCGGALPANLAELLSLPGIGRYTAGAVLSIAYGQDVPAIDGNVVRVLCRLFDYDGDPRQAEGQATLRRHADALLPRGRAGVFNQAMMELGATLCAPRTPRCDACPLAAHCRARAQGVQERRPIPKERKALPHRRLAAALIEREGKLLLVRRLPKGLLGGLWELPNAEPARDENDEQALARALRTSLGLFVQVGNLLGTVEHAYTHFRVTVGVYRCSACGDPDPGSPWDDHRWLACDELDNYGLTGVTTRALARLPAS